MGLLPTKDSKSMIHLHANDGVDEEEHRDEQDDIGERLEGLHEGPE